MKWKIAENRIIFPTSPSGRPRHKLFLNETQSLYKNLSSVVTKNTTSDGTKEVTTLLGRSVFPFPKPSGLIKLFAEQSTGETDIILDFFAGSGTTAEAVMRLNFEDGGTRQFILVQIPQPIDPKKQKEAHTFVTETLGKPEATIFEITAERIRRAGAKINADKPEVDTGFRVFELVDDPDALILDKPLQDATQADLATLQASIATPQPAQLPRVLHNLLLAEGLPLTTRIAPVHNAQITEGCLYLAADVLLVVKAVPMDALTDILRELHTAGTPVHYLTVYAPWVDDNNFHLGIQSVASTLGFSEDKLRLRG
jgi:adenine-specific DNA-methyltransferase